MHRNKGNRTGAQLDCSEVELACGVTALDLITAIGRISYHQTLLLVTEHQCADTVSSFSSGQRMQNRRCTAHFVLNQVHFASSFLPNMSLHPSSSRWAACTVSLRLGQCSSNSTRLSSHCSCFIHSGGRALQSAATSNHQSSERNTTNPLSTSMTTHGMLSVCSLFPYQAYVAIHVF